MITYIVKISGVCNLSCKYCYYLTRRPNEYNNIIKSDLLESFLWQTANLSDDVQIIWHGGEPLLAGIDFFTHVLEIQEMISRRKQTVFHNKIQTNATLINEQWINIFLRGNFGIGISLDGSKIINDVYRKTNQGKGSFDLVMNGIEKLKDHQIHFSILSVVSKANLGKENEIFDFYREQNFDRFDFLPCVEIDQRKNVCEYCDYSLQAGDYSSFMIQMFDRWFTLDNPSISIRFFEEVLFALLGNSAGLCHLSGTCGNYITMNFDGSIFPCDNFIGVDELSFGNIQQDALSKIIFGPKRNKFISSIGKIRKECEGCEFWNICKGGCSYYSYFINKQFTSENFFCNDRKLIFAHIINTLKKNHYSLYRNKILAKNC
ncbi:MAG: SPASM domain-containing protein [Anaerolineaceae bacterium]|nr:SPASM domain-containing protein [Anaerolineaceae bacterium]